jgi:hypothetical protein
VKDVTTGFFTKPADRATLYYMGNTRSIVAIAALAAAAAAMSACSSPADNTAAPAAGDVVISTAGQTAEATAAAMRAAAAPKADNWVSVPASASSVPFGTIAPGGIIYGIDAEGDMAHCTITAATPAGEILTAGHCGLAGSARFIEAGSTIGVVEQSVDELPLGSTGVATDAAIAKVTIPVTSAASRVADRPIAGVMTVAGVRTLPKGTALCFDGVASGIKCGSLVKASSVALETDVISQGGDSGAPVFLIDGTTGAVTLIGVLRGDTDNHMHATYLDPALSRFGAQVLVDASAAAAVTGDPRYSHNVSTPN